MGRIYADIIIDISTEKLDRAFRYLVPEELAGELQEGMEVTIPFGKGNSRRKGYVIGFSDTPNIDEARIKSIICINKTAVSAKGRVLTTAAWIKNRYGSTMINALRTVLPVKKKIKKSEYSTVCRNATPDEILIEIKKLDPVRYISRIRILNALLEAKEIPQNMITDKLGVSSSVLKTLEKRGFIRIEKTREYRNPMPDIIGAGINAKGKVELNDQQKNVVEGILAEIASGSQRPCLIRGVTGSGKTEVYMELIADTIKKGRQAIVLIPEIALTFQTLMRFYGRFGDRVSVIHSRLSEGERYDQYERAAAGELDIMIGPRSALFTPFDKLGMIIIDEEHETSYKSEKMPKYHAVEVAEYLAKREGAALVLGSATPSLNSYYKAQKGEYALFKMDMRAGEGRLPVSHIVDMRAELKSGNKSFLSRALADAITKRNAAGEQSMLFVNRRGVAGFISCRSCGYVVKCPHCDVSMTQHMNGRLVCHYCGHTEGMPSVCPKCNMRSIAGFRVGTEAVEKGLKEMYPGVGILRMDADTTRKKEDYEKILSAFANGEAQILIGTQMIVKGHDFPNVTLVGALAADMSLHAADYHAAERTFELIAQAAGRAGRGARKGEVFIQSYDPDHFALKCAATHDYEGFYEQEITYRELADYPPVCHILVMQFFGRKQEDCMARAQEMAERARILCSREKTDTGENPQDSDGTAAGSEGVQLIRSATVSDGSDGLQVIGPAPATISRIKDVYRVGLYFKHEDVNLLTGLKDMAEKAQEQHFATPGDPEVSMQFDLDPVGMF